MAINKKITECTELTTAPAADDLVVLVDISDTTDAASGTTKKQQWLNTIKWLFGSRFGADAGANDTYVVTLIPAPAAYINGEHYRFKANTVNTGAATVNFNSLGAKTIKKHRDQDLANGDIEAGQWVDLVYDSVNDWFQMQSQLGNAPAGGVGGLGDFVGPASSIDSEFVLFDSTTGKLGKRATGTGFVKAASGVYSTEASPTTGLPFDYAVAVSDETTSITTGAAKVTFYFPVAVNITGVSAGLTGQSTSGAVTINVKKNGTTIFSTTLTIDANEDTSHTAATPAVLTSSPTAFSVTDKVTIDIDGAGTSAEGLKVSFTGTRQ